MSFNKIIVVGNLGGDPDLRYTPQGSAVANFSMATNEKRKDKAGEMQDVTTWFRVTLWNKQAENAAKYLTKGSPIFIEGRLRVEEWQDRDGNNRHTLEVQATDMQFIGSNQGGQQREEAPTSEFSGGATGEGAETWEEGARKAVAAKDDIPF